jgi:tetratricopeptide (TPR) repeat protein
VVFRWLSFLFLGGLTVAPLPQPLCAQSLDARFVSGLRQRRLFELAEGYSTDRLGQIGPSESAYGELTVELIRTLTLHAVHSPPHQRQPLWDQARTVAADFLRHLPPHPHTLLVRFQDALTLLTQGELGRQEYDVGALAGEQLEAIQRALREATSLLEALDKEVRTETTRRRRAAPRAGELTADELANLADSVQHQLARAQRNRALLFPRGSDDRLALLLAAADTLQRLLPQIPETRPLKAEAHLDLAECQRLLSRPAESAELAAHLDREGVDPVIRLRARAELIRVALAANQLEAAQRIIQRGREIGDHNSADLDLACFEAYVAFARAATEGQRLSPDDRNPRPENATKYEQQAVEAAERMEQVHGPYWGRRASQSLVASVPRSSLGSAELLSRAADGLYLKGDLEGAIAAYDDAAGQARAKADLQAAFELAYKAALVEHQRGRHAAAANRLRIVARSIATHPQAAPAHLLAVWNAARVDSGGGGATQYEELLAEHLATWPTAESADQARLWLGKLQESRLNWATAIDTYSAVSRSSPHYAAAVESLARCWRNEVAALVAAGKPAEDAAMQAIGHFRRAIVGSENRWPQRWTQADRIAALAAAELIVAYQPGSASDAEELLRRALDGAVDAPHPWQTAAQSQLVLALAVQSRRQDDALAILSAIGDASSEQMFAVFEGLSHAGKRAGEQTRSQIARLQLEAASRLAAGREQLTAEQQLTLERVRAEALAAIGRHDEALVTFERLATDNPQNGVVQEGLARLLLSSSSPAQLKRALDQWRVVASRSKPRTPRWYEAKYSVALAQCKLGDREGAATLLRYLLEAPPGLAGSEWEAAYRELLAKCSQPVAAQ